MTPRTFPLRALAAVVTAGAMLAIPTMATAADTTVSFTVAASGALSVAQAASVATLTSGGDPLDFSAVASGAVTGSLPQTTVTDTRGNLAGAWTVTAGATGPFVNASNNAITVPASAGRVYFGVSSLVDLTTNLTAGITGVLITGAELSAGTSNLGTPYTLLSGTTTLGTGSIVYTPSVSVTVPAATPVGTYSTVVQQTVS